MKIVMRALLVLVLLSPPAALAHTGAGAVHDFEHGFLHPFGGLDHLLAMIAVGVFSAHLGGRALLLVPLSFVAVMALGGAIGFAGIRLPYVEAAIALSSVVLGLFIALRTRMPMIAAALVVGGFALFHGHAHGAELPDGNSPFAYATGFLIATALLHVAGIALGFASLSSSTFGHRLVQAGGGAVAIAGAVLLTRAVIT